MKKIFISYRRDDATSVAHMISEHITKRFREKNVFFDLTGIIPGDNWRGKISDALMQCGVFVEIIGNQWLEPQDSVTGQRRRRLDEPDDVLRFEIETALAKSVPIIPLLVDRATLPRKEDVPASLHALFDAQALTLNPEKGHYNRDIETLLTTIEEKVALAREDDPQRAFSERIESIASSLPTPLAKIAEEARLDPDRRAFHLNRLFMEGLRLLSLVALHDTIASGCFGSGQANPGASLQLLTKEMTLNDWYAILRNSIQDGHTGNATLIAPEIQDWAEDPEVASLLEDMLESRGTWRYDDDPSGFASIESPEHLEANLLRLFSDFLFFKRYLLILVTQPPASMDNVFSCRILRGFDLSDNEVSLVISDTADWVPRALEIYLLDIDEKQCLSMGPSLWFGLGEASDQIGGLCKLHIDEGEVHIVHVKAFRTHDRLLVLDSQWQQRVGEAGIPKLPGDPPVARRTAGINKLLAGWIGPERIHDAFEVRVPGRRQEAIVENALDDASWQQLKSISNPPRSLDSIAGKFRLENPPFRIGELVDIYRGAEKGQESVASLAFHILRSDVQDDSDVSRWFSDRLDRWRRLPLKCVNVPYAASCTTSHDTPPFIVTAFIDDGISLETRIQREGQIDRECIVRVIQDAVHLCAAAHSKNIYLLSLPPRHFLINEQGGFRVTGFETAVSGDTDLRAIDWNRFTKDWKRMAPEIKQGAQRPHAAMDIFAIGVLLQQLRERPAKPIYAMGPEDLQDMLDVLAFHCLSEDVNLRFRSMHQLGCFVEHYVCHDAGHAPRTVDIPGGRVSAFADGDRGDAVVQGFKLGVYPVTNYQYQQFWMSTGHRAPHISANYRLHGPWCPVIGVDLTDAQAYCQWLTGNSSVRWRIPTEAEWLRAATLDDARAYPWGDDDALVPCDATGNSAGANGSAEPRANFGEYFRGPTPVGAFESGKSAAGCYDMGGNVWEWCTDHLGNGLPFRVIKGGAYDFGKESLQVRARNRALVGKRSGHLGFRVLCEGAD